MAESRGMVLRQFFEVLEEIDFFMSVKGKSVPQLTSKDWIKDLAFLVDIMTYVNTLAISLRECSQVVTQMHDSFSSLFPNEIVSLGNSFGKEQSGPLPYVEISFRK